MPSKIRRLLAVMFIIVLISSSTVFAKIYIDKTGGGKSDSVYVAGNPDLYPIEYYDPDTETYKGLIPDMLKLVSKQTGLDFTYISAGSENRQKSLYRNNQAELITAILSDDKKYEDAEKFVALAVESDGKAVNYCICFTDAISGKTKDKIVDALDDISVNQKNGFIVNNAVTDLLASRRQLVIMIICSSSVAFLILASIAIVIIRKKRKENIINRMIDKNTGVGNADYYVYAFEQLISEQSRNLYNLAYIAFDINAFEHLKSNISIKEVEKLAAAKLINYTTAAEYLSLADNGVFALIFQSENDVGAEKRVSEIVSGVNEYIYEHLNGIGNMFRVGYCRLCEHKGIDAEGALYNAKQGYLYAEANDTPYHIGTKALADENKKVEALALQIDDALKNNDFKIHLQFIVNAENGKFCGAEVLSRWQNREYGLLRPPEYISVLNKTGNIVEHDYCIFENACRQLALWNKPPFDKLFLTCNFTRISFSKADFADRLNEIVLKYNVPHNRLAIEITEDTLVENLKNISENIKKLSASGFRVTIDDMGAGFSSLSDIYDNEFDIVKIEREFVVSCVSDRKRRMLKNIIYLVHNAGAKVICEGIETAEQFDMLKSIGCDMIQGFYFSRVLPLSECERFIISNFEKSK